MSAEMIYGVNNHGSVIMLKANSILPLELCNVNYSVRGHTLLRDISLMLDAGRTTVILGPNGAGKSLLLRLCHGLIAPVSGSIEWKGPQATQAQQYQAMVFQRPVLLRRSVVANVEYALNLRGTDKHKRRERVQQALEMAGLTALGCRGARVLSGGEQQRLALARAWVLQPEVLFLDEPTSNLDPSATCAVEEVISAFRDAGIKIVMTTHDLGQARRLADEIVFINHGRLLEVKAAKEFFIQPCSKDARAYLRGELLW